MRFEINMIHLWKHLHPDKDQEPQVQKELRAGRYQELRYCLAGIPQFKPEFGVSLHRGWLSVGGCI
jgi:hypothetical protein